MSPCLQQEQSRLKRLTIKEGHEKVIVRETSEVEDHASLNVSGFFQSFGNLTLVATTLAKLCSWRDSLR